MPHSKAKRQPVGADSGSGGTGVERSGRRRVRERVGVQDGVDGEAEPVAVVEVMDVTMLDSQAPRPAQAWNSWLFNGAEIAPIMGRPWTTSAMETANAGKQWT